MRNGNPSDYQKDGSPAARLHVRAIGLPGVYGKPWQSPSVPTRSRVSRPRVETNGIVGRRAKQRAKATGKPVDHRGRKVRS